MSLKTVFNSDWAHKQLNPQWAEWTENVPNSSYVSRCRLCKKIFSLSNMGREALTSHEEVKKYLKKIKISNQSS